MVRRCDLERNPIHSFPDEIFTDTKQILSEYGISHRGLQAIQENLTRVAAEPWMVEHPAFVELERTGATLKVIASQGDDDLTLVAGRFPADHPTPVHDHTTWGVACVVRGRDRYIHWERLDDGSRLDEARLRVQYERVLEPGDSVYWFDPPGDIHSQQGDGETALELVLFGKNPQAAIRHTFDPATRQIQELKSS